MSWSVSWSVSLTVSLTACKPFIYRGFAVSLAVSLVVSLAVPLAVPLCSQKGLEAHREAMFAAGLAAAAAGPAVLAAGPAAHREAAAAAGRAVLAAAPAAHREAAAAAGGRAGWVWLLAGRPAWGLRAGRPAWGLRAGRGAVAGSPSAPFRGQGGRPGGVPPPGLCAVASGRRRSVGRVQSGRARGCVQAGSAVRAPPAWPQPLCACPPGPPFLPPPSSRSVLGPASTPPPERLPLPPPLRSGAASHSAPTSPEPPSPPASPKPPSPPASKQPYPATAPARIRQHPKTPGAASVLNCLKCRRPILLC